MLEGLSHLKYEEILKEVISSGSYMIKLFIIAWKFPDSSKKPQMLYNTSILVTPD